VLEVHSAITLTWVYSLEREKAMNLQLILQNKVAALREEFGIHDKNADKIDTALSLLKGADYDVEVVPSCELKDFIQDVENNYSGYDEERKGQTKVLIKINNRFKLGSDV